MLWHGIPNSCGLWLPEDKKADMWHGRGNSVAQKTMILAKNEDTCMKQLFKSNVLYVSSYYHS